MPMTFAYLLAAEGQVCMVADDPAAKRAEQQALAECPYRFPASRQHQWDRTPQGPSITVHPQVIMRPMFARCLDRCPRIAHIKSVLWIVKR